MKGVLISGILFALLLPATTSALPSDVSETDWFSEAVNEFVDAGYLDKTMNARPSDKATRGEFVKLIVELTGGVTGGYVDFGFTDLNNEHPLYEYFFEAGEQKWLKGEGSCYNANKPCNAYPDRPINRAEAAALIMRAFNKFEGGNAPDFKDNKVGMWYWKGIKNAASHCVLKGDNGSKNVRPSDNMNRAEMIVMLHRLHGDLRYPNCDKQLDKRILPAKKVARERGNSTDSDPYYKKGFKATKSGLTTTPANIPAKEKSIYCTASSWSCGEWGECIRSVQTRKCQLVENCLYPEHYEPDSINDTCTRTVGSNEVPNAIEQLKDLHERIFERAEKYLYQPNAREGLVELDTLEDDVLKWLNLLIKHYNREITMNDSTLTSILDYRIGGMERVFNNLPLIYYPTPTVRNCTISDWQCTAWEACKYDKQKRQCYQLSTDCIGSTPALSQACKLEDSPIVIRINQDLVEWKEFHNQIIARARDYQSQGASSYIVLLHDIETAFLSIYNLMVGYQNSDYPLEALERMEDKMDALIDRFNSLPTIIY